MNLERIRNEKVKMILQFSIPSIIAMVLTAMITVVDGFFMGNYVGTSAIAAVNIGLPIIYLFLGVGLMISVGGVAISGISYGAGDIDKSKQVFNQTMVTVLIASVILTAISAIGMKFIVQILGVDRILAEYFMDYYSIILIYLPIMIVNASFGMFIRSEGKPQYFMKVTILNLILNIVFDYVCVKYLSLGVKGIALASLASTIVCLLAILHFFMNKSHIYKLGKFKFSSEIFRKTILNGASEFIGELSLAISIFAYNFVIMKYVGSNGISAFAVVGYLSYVFNMIIVGFGQGLVPLVGFAYGAKDINLARSLRRTTNKIVTGVGCTVFMLVLITSKAYSRIFVDEVQVQVMIEKGIMIYASSFLFLGVNTISSFYFTSIGRAKESAIISAARGLIILVINISIFPMLFGMTGVWLISPVTEITTLLISIYFIMQEKKHIKKEKEIFVEEYVEMKL